MIAIDLKGRNALVLGVANRRSLAWSIAERLDQAGARLVLTYQGERLKTAVEKLAEGLDRKPLILPCDVTDESQLDALFSTIGGEMPHLDSLVHSVAYANREDLQGAFRDTSRQGWRIALEVSAYSLVALMARATPMMERTDESDAGGSVVTLSYLGAERAMPNYNVMGSAKAALEHAVRQLALELGPKDIRVNAISAGPVSTLSARGLGDFNVMLKHHRERSCMRRNVTGAEVGDSGLFLLSDLGSGITGETMHVDCGYSIVGI